MVNSTFSSLGMYSRLDFCQKNGGQIFTHFCVKLIVVDMVNRTFCSLVTDSMAWSG